MKQRRKPIPLFCMLLVLLCNSTNAQLWKRVQQEVKNRVSNRAVSASGQATDAVLDKVENSVLTTPDPKKRDASAATLVAEKEGPTDSQPAEYKNYDFVTGDRIIFQPDLSKEPAGELPARFTLDAGSAEIQSEEGDKILHLDKGASARVSPQMNSDHYLPEQFTLEFDLEYENDADRFAFVNDVAVPFYARGNNNGGAPLYRFDISNNGRCIWGNNNSYQYFPAVLQKSMSTKNTWHHIALYVHKNIGKAYIDGYRVAVSNTLPVGAGNVALVSDPHYGLKIKNFRLAAGGDDKYQKIVTNGKFVTHGILFDVSQATIKPESTGALQEVVKLMQDHPDLKFEIDGHTDSDGNAAVNLNLSKSRADAVKAKLIDMGIDADRITTKGFGAQKPIDTNSTAEGKANNRRVEFVKI